MKRIITLAGIMLVALAFGQVNIKADDIRLSPRLLNYQGYITDTLGNPINNPAVSVTFGIWSSAGGGTQLWYETQLIGVTKGIFSVLLGNTTPIPDSIFTKSTDRWMELTYAGITLSPRTRIVSVGYAVTSTFSDTAVSVVDNAITTPKILDTAVTMVKIAPAGASPGQVIKWSGAAWQPGADAVGTDADWNYLVSDGSDTTLQMGGRWGLARPGNVLYGAADSTHVNFGVACTTGFSGQDFKYCAVGGGYVNKASGFYSTVSGGTQNVAGNAAGNSCPTVGGGFQNSASGDYYATVGGGYSNEASGFNSATIAGGYNNTASNSYTTVSGGQNNTASYTHATVAGGQNNTAGGWYTAVGGGYYNAATGRYSTAAGGHSDTVTAFFGGIGAGYNNNAGDAAEDTAAVVSGGRDNWAIARYTYVGGGLGNVADSNYATVGGGGYNTAHGFSSVISGGCYGQTGDNYGTLGGGVRDTVKAPYGVVVGGYSNLAGDASADTASVVVGGWNNSATGKNSYVGGGGNNCASFDYATVGGGINDTASGEYSFVGGGQHNTAEWTCATVAGGSYNKAKNSGNTIGGGVGNITDYPNSTVSGGWENVASNNFATVAGGLSDSSMGNNSFTVGNNSTVLAAYNNSAAFNGQTATASGQTRVGALSKASGTFTIDHPLDPENKILNHYFVESPEMVLIYRGVAQIGDNGRAVVYLPDYFNALNESPMIQLTGVKSNEVWVEEKVKKNEFTIGGQPGIEVYWTVTGCRKDPSAEITKILMPVEQAKEGGLAGRSLDDEFLVVTMEQLERMGKADGFKFRRASEQRRYEEWKKMIQDYGNE